MAESDPAAGRFFTIQLLRLGGAIMVVGAILILTDTVDVPDLAGFVLLALGLAGFFVVPILLARKWSTRGK